MGGKLLHEFHGFGFISSLQQYRTSKCIADPGEKLDNQVCFSR